MEQETLEKQKDFYNRKFNNLRFKLMFKLFFSKVVMKKLGRDKDYFKYNKGFAKRRAIFLFFSRRTSYFFIYCNTYIFFLQFYIC